MADRDHVIRIILEAKENASQVIGKGAQNLSREVESFKKKVTGLSNEQDRLDATFRRTERSMGRQSGLFAAARKGADDLAQAVSRVRSETDKLGASGERVKNGGFLQGVRGGVEAAADERARISRRFAQTKEEFDERRKEIQSEFEVTSVAINTAHKNALAAIRAEHAERLIGIRKEGAEALRNSVALAKVEAAKFQQNIDARNKLVDAESVARLSAVNESNARLLRGEQERAQKARSALQETLDLESAALNEQLRLREEALRQEQFRRRQILTEEIATLRSERDQEKKAVDKAVFQQEIDARQEAERRLKLDEERALNEEIAKRRDALKADHATRLAIINAEGDAAIETQRQKNNLELQSVRTTNEEELKAARDRNAEDKKASNELIASRKEAQEAINRSIIVTENNARDIAIATESDRAETARRINRVTREQEKDANKNPDIASIFADEREVTKRTENLARGFENVGFKAGRAFHDIRTGFQNAKNGFRTAEGAAAAAAGVFQSFGFAVGKVVTNFGNFVNLRWLVLTGFIASFLSLMLQAGVAIVAFASSLAIAGAALGGAFLAGLSQVIPVAGLFAAAMIKVKEVLAAVKLSDAASLRSSRDAKAAMEARVTAAQRLSDAHHTLTNALASVSDADYNLAQASQRIVDAQERQHTAVRKLNDARKKAARDIVDANLAERKSALELKDAELAVVDAKRKLREEELKKRQSGADVGDAQAAVREANQRLAIARQEGDQAQISQAAQAASLARQNLDDVSAQADEIKNNVAQAQVDVQKSTLAVEQARVAKSRATQDAAQARTRGVSGSDEVISAQKELKDSTEGIAEARHAQAQALRAVGEAIHAVAIARREEADARRATKDPDIGKTSAQSALEEAKANLTKSQLGLFNAIVEIKKVFKKEFGPITDIIVDSFTRAVKRVTILLQDPEIIKAATGLARSVAAAIDTISKFVVSPEFKRDLLFFINEAKANLPAVARILINIFRVFANISKAGSRIFASLLDGLDGLAEKGARASSNSKRLNTFFEAAGKHLRSWIEFGKAVARVLFFLAGGAAPSGKGLLDSFTANLNDIADWLKENPEKVHKFFDRMAEQIRKTAGELAKLAKLLTQALSSDEFANLATTFTEILIPGLVTFLSVLGKVSGGLLAILNIPIIGDLVKLALTIAITERAFNKLFPFTQHITNAFKSLALLGFKKAAYELRFLMLMLAESAFGQVLIRAARAVVLFSRTTALALLTNPWVLAIAAVIAAIVLLDRKFHFIRPTIEALRKAFNVAFDWIKDHWKLLAGIILAPFLIILLPIIKWRNQIITAFTYLINFIRDHWKGLGKILLAIFLPGAFVLVQILKFRDTFVRIFNGIKSTVVGVFNAIEKAIKSVIKRITGGLGEIWDKVPGPLKKVLQVAADPVGAAKDLGKGTVKRIGGLFGIGHYRGGVAGEPGSIGDTDTVPAMLTPGEWILNSGQQRKLAAALGQSAQQTKAFLFGTNIGTKTPSGKAQEPVLYGKTFNLVPRTDDNNNTVYFIEFADGTFGQVSNAKRGKNKQSDVDKIISSRGAWIPGYVKRNAHGFSQQTMQRISKGGYDHGFALGGVVPQGFANGGVVSRPATMGRRNGNTVNQDFSVYPQGDTDWHAVMRLGALHAQESF